MTNIFKLFRTSNVVSFFSKIISIILIVLIGAGAPIFIYAQETTNNQETDAAVTENFAPAISPIQNVSKNENNSETSPVVESKILDSKPAEIKKEVSVTTVGLIRRAGGEVLNTGSGSHATIFNLSGEKASPLFQEIFKNPNR